MGVQHAIEQLFHVDHPSRRLRPAQDRRLRVDGRVWRCRTRLWHAPVGAPVYTGMANAADSTILLWSSLRELTPSLP